MGFTSGLIMESTSIILISPQKTDDFVPQAMSDHFVDFQNEEPSDEDFANDFFRLFEERLRDRVGLLRGIDQVRKDAERFEKDSGKTLDRLDALFGR